MIDYQPVKRVAIDATGQEVQDVATFRWQFGMSVAEEGETFKPRPFPVEHVTLDDGLNRIIEPVAVQLHEVRGSCPLGVLLCANRACVT